MPILESMDCAPQLLSVAEFCLNRLSETRELMDTAMTSNSDDQLTGDAALSHRVASLLSKFSSENVGGVGGGPFERESAMN